MKQEIYYRIATPADYEGITHMKLRRSDVEELKASTPMKQKAAILQSVEVSDLLWVVCKKEEERENIIAVVGVAPTLRQSTGSPWLLATEEFTKHKYRVAKHSIDILSAMLKRYPYLFNLVSDANMTSKKWLQWLGFTIDHDNKVYLYSKTQAFVPFHY